MDFSWSEEQLAFKKRFLTFARDELNDDVAARDREGTFAHDLWKKCADFGLQGMAVPETYSGTPEIDILTSMLVMEAMGYGCRDNGLTFALNAQMWTVQLPIQQYGTDAQKERFLPDFCSGKRIGAHAITEPEAGSDVFSMRTKAERSEGGYVLNGSKQYVSLAPIADVALIFASTNPAVGQWGITAFLVEKDTPGYKVSPTREKMGLRTVPIGEIFLTDCCVPEENRIGKEGAGFSISNHSLEYERCCILASQLGAMERQLETAVAYARTRRQFGQPIGKFQSVANRITDMKLRLETARLLLYKVAWLKKMGKPAMMEAALVKLHVSECFVASGLDAIRTHGGAGYMTSLEVERDFRDAVGGVLYAGTSDIQRNIIARLLGL